MFEGVKKPMPMPFGFREFFDRYYPRVAMEMEFEHLRADEV